MTACYLLGKIFKRWEICLTEEQGLSSSRPAYSPHTHTTLNLVSDLLFHCPKVFHWVICKLFSLGHKTCPHPSSVPSALFPALSDVHPRLTAFGCCTLTEVTGAQAPLDRRPQKSCSTSKTRLVAEYHKPSRGQELLPSPS